MHPGYQGFHSLARRVLLSIVAEGDWPAHAAGAGFGPMPRRNRASEVPAPGALPATDKVIQVIYGYGDGTSTIGPIYTVDSAVDDILAADLNGDGKTDLVVLTEPKTPGTPYRIATLLAKQAADPSAWSPRRPGRQDNSATGERSYG